MRKWFVLSLFIGVLAAYVGFLREIPGIAGHLITASLLSAPASLAIAKVLVPETETPETTGALELDTQSEYANVFDAAAQGATNGAKLAINVGAMLIAFVGLIAMVDAVLGVIPFGAEPLTLSRMFGWLFAPFAFLMGVPWADCATVGSLLGEKLVLTEFFAFAHLGQILNADPDALDPRSAVIASYALCGFANFASIGVQLGGLGGIAPKRSQDIAALALRAMIGGTLAAFMTACVAGIFIDAS